MLRKPPHILITTPESLGLALASKRFRPLLNDLKWLIVDELHSLVPTKRGTHLSLSLALMDSVVESDVQRIGISATMEPLNEVAEFLVASDSKGGRGKRPESFHSQNLRIEETRPRHHLAYSEIYIDTREEILDHNIDRIKELVESHTTTLVFVNTRNMTETFVQRLKVAGLEGVEGHHGSMDKSIRLDVSSNQGRLAEMRCLFIQPRDGDRYRIS